MTAQQTDKSYVWPARHQAGAANNKNLPPMGARFRLKASFSTAGYRSDTKVILTAMKKYGMILADNGSDWYFTGAASDDWSNDMLDELKSIPASAFESVDASSLMISPNSGKAKTQSAPAPKPEPKPSTASPKPKPKPSTQSPAPTPSPTPTVSSAPPSPASSPTNVLSLPDRPHRGSKGPAWWPWAIVAALVAAGVFVVKRYLVSRTD
jgi:hypothetical protein